MAEKSKEIYESGMSLLKAIHDEYKDTEQYQKLVSNMRSVLNELHQLRLDKLLNIDNSPKPMDNGVL